MSGAPMPNSENSPRAAAWAGVRSKEAVIAKAIFDGLKRRNPDAYVSPEPELHRQTVIDGRFYLMAVARRVIAALADFEARKER